MSNKSWSVRKIGTLGKVVTGKTPSTANSAFFGGDTPFITIPDLGNSVFIHTSERTLSESGVKAVKGSLLPKDAVMMSCIATIGKCGITTKPSVTNQQINSVICNSDVDPRFLYYTFTQLGRELDAAGGGGSVYTNVSKARFSDIEIPLPPLPEQRAIADILGALDDKIELNRRMNHTLEQMARALFKSWFVDFDPVRRNAERRMKNEECGMQNAEEALFPSAFEGDIPQGWRVEEIGNMVKVVGGSTPSTKNPEYWDGEYHWATPKDLSALQSPILLDTERKITKAGVAQISSGILPAGTLLMSSRAPVGYLAISEIPVSINQGFIGMICDGDLPNYYVLHWAQTNMEAIQGRANGTTFMEISKSNFRPMSVIVPSPQVLQKFVEQVEPLYKKISANLQQSRTLAALRDALLPRLMSGEIRVKDEG